MCCHLQGHQGGCDVKVIFILRLPESELNTDINALCAVLNHSCAITGLLYSISGLYFGILKTSPNHYQLMTPSSRLCWHLITRSGPPVLSFSQHTSVAWLLFLQVKSKHFMFTCQLVLVKKTVFPLLKRKNWAQWFC